VRLVIDETRLVPEAKPFVWSAERDVVRLTLGGSSPLPASKGRLLEAARGALEAYDLETQKQERLVDGISDFWVGRDGKAPAKPATLQRKVACLRSFHRHLRRQNLIEDDPTEPRPGDP